MTQCYQCQGVTSADLEPCPNDPPCKPYDVCGYQVTRCRHKTEAANTCDRCGHSVHDHEDEGSAPCNRCECEEYQDEEQPA